MRFALFMMCFVLAAIDPGMSAAQRAGDPAVAEGTFRYVRTFVPRCGEARYLHEYVAGDGKRVVVASSDAQPSESDQLARIRYRPVRRHTLRLSIDACARGPLEEVRVDGEPISVRGYPIESGLFRYVHHYNPTCTSVDHPIYEFVSLDGSTRLLVRGTRHPLVPAELGDIHAIRFRRMPAHTRRFSPNACAGAAPIAIEAHGEAIALGPAGDTHPTTLWPHR